MLGIFGQNISIATTLQHDIFKQMINFEGACLILLQDIYCLHIRIYFIFGVLCYLEGIKYLLFHLTRALIDMDGNNIVYKNIGPYRSK